MLGIRIGRHPRQNRERRAPDVADVFVLRDVEGLSIGETAQALKLSRAAVKARLWRVRLHLRERLNRYFERAPFAPEEPTPTCRVTTKITGLFAECLCGSILAHIRLASLGNKIVPRFTFPATL